MQIAMVQPPQPEILPNPPLRRAHTRAALAKLLPTMISLMLLSACDRPEDAAGGNSAEAGTRPSALPANDLTNHAAAPRPLQPDAKGTASPHRPISPCLMQDGERLASRPLRALGTEPFWAVRIEGRCVTYSHPEDQAGTRVWTRYAPTTDGGLWRGSLGGRPFELRTRSAPGCSDGMSDRSYPVGVELLVNGEKRNGCAEPLNTIP